jgi:hypothetical protein
VGQEMVASARIIETKGKKRVVSVRIEVDGKPVLEGTLTTFVLDCHVFDI